MDNKHDDNLAETLSIRLSSRERAQLEILASRDDRPVTAFARHILRQALQTMGAQAA
jgi:plasmid stability protein